MGEETLRHLVKLLSNKHGQNGDVVSEGGQRSRRLKRKGEKPYETGRRHQLGLRTPLLYRPGS